MSISLNRGRSIARHRSLETAAEKHAAILDDGW
jgi:hypothetical protein